MKSILNFIVLLCTFCTIVHAQTETACYKVEGHCGSCKTKIETAAKIDGVKKASWDLDSKVLTVKYNSKSTSQDKVFEAVSKTGFQSEKMEACCKKGSGKSKGKKEDCCKDKSKSSSLNISDVLSASNETFIVDFEILGDTAKCCKKDKKCKDCKSKCCKSGTCEKCKTDCKSCCKGGKCGECCKDKTKSSSLNISDVLSASNETFIVDFEILGDTAKCCKKDKKCKDCKSKCCKSGTCEKCKTDCKSCCKGGKCGECCKDKTKSSSLNISDVLSASNETFIVDFEILGDTAKCCKKDKKCKDCKSKCCKSGTCEKCKTDCKSCCKGGKCGECCKDKTKSSSLNISDVLSASNETFIVDFEILGDTAKCCKKDKKCKDCKSKCCKSGTCEKCKTDCKSCCKGGKCGECCKDKSKASILNRSDVLSASNETFIVDFEIIGDKKYNLVQ